MKKRIQRHLYLVVTVILGVLAVLHWVRFGQDPGLARAIIALQMSVGYSVCLWVHTVQGMVRYYEGDSEEE